MRWYVSYPILAAGLAFGADTLFPGEPSVTRPLSESRSLIAAAAETMPEILMASELEAQPASRLATFSPGEVLLAARPAQKSVLDYLARTLTPSETAPQPVAVAAPVLPVTAATWTSAVIRDTHASADSAPVPTARPDTPASRVALARDIQRELRRVGCYLGEIDGVWGSGSKRATHAFMDRVNASLPTQEPDVFVLSLLRAHSDSVCGGACPRGQSATAKGRCVPTTLVAQAGGSTYGAPRGSMPRVTAEVVRSEPAPHQRMGIGGPKPDDLAPHAADWAADGTRTAAAPSLARTAALETASIEDGLRETAPARMPRVTRSALEPAGEGASERRAKAGRSKAARATPTRTSTYRQVQHLFQHPLGRM